MKYEIFENMMGNLYLYYGSKEGKGKAAHDEYYNILKTLPNENADLIFSSVLKQYKFFPTVVEIKEVADSMRQGDNHKKKENAEICYYCMNRGAIWYFKKDPKSINSEYLYEYVSRCPMCDAGEYYKNIPSFASVMGEQALELVKTENMRKYATEQNTVAHKLMVKSYLEEMGL